MRKLKLQVQISVDGFIAGSGGEVDWMVWNWDTELKKYVYNLTRTVDCIVLGRNLASVFVDSWQNRLNDPSTADAFSRKMVETPKVVFSKSLGNISWKNTKLAKGDLVDEILRLKKMKGRDIIAYGGVSFLSSLIKYGLVDEYNLFVNPVVLGEGMSIFKNLENSLKLELVYATTFDCGITALCYVPAKRMESKAGVKVETGSEENSL